ncbi:hypothetical protein RFY41_06495, partial [Acinetobacter soli]|uniref:hypothetical protein n=1 Tax=Acinetobacter soli TaxID=487316 RepID=UPI0028138818
YGDISAGAAGAEPAAVVQLSGWYLAGLAADVPVRLSGGLGCVYVRAVSGYPDSSGRLDGAGHPVCGNGAAGRAAGLCLPDAAPAGSDPVY